MRLNFQYSTCGDDLEGRLSLQCIDDMAGLTAIGITIQAADQDREFWTGDWLGIIDGTPLLEPTGQLSGGRVHLTEQPGGVPAQQGCKSSNQNAGKPCPAAPPNLPKGCT